MNNQTCGNCKWAIWLEMTKHNPPRRKPGYSGRCNWPVPDVDVRPIAIMHFATMRKPIFAKDTNCPCWEGKDE